MGNLGLQTGKEQWMEPLTPVIKESVSDIKSFIDQLVDIDENAGITTNTYYVSGTPSLTCSTITAVW